MKRVHPDAWIHPFLMWAIIIAGVIVSFDIFPKSHLYKSSFLSYIVSAACVVYWVYFFTRGISANMEASFSASRISRLVTSGAYEEMRHPLYSADMALVWGIFISYPLPAVLMSAAWLTLVMVIWAHLEEQSLERLFKDAYRAYKKKTWAFVPFKKKHIF